MPLEFELQHLNEESKEWEINAVFGMLNDALASFKHDVEEGTICRLITYRLLREGTRYVGNGVYQDDPEIAAIHGS